MDGNRQELTQIYEDAIYVVFDNEREIRFRVGENSAEINALLEKENAERFAFLTAHNPHSKGLTAADNDLRQSRLKQILQVENYRFLEGYGTNESESWDREASLFVLDIAEEAVINLARNFEQNAILCGAKNEKCRLVWC